MNSPDRTHQLDESYSFQSNLVPSLLQGEADPAWRWRLFRTPAQPKQSQGVQVLVSDLTLYLLPYDFKHDKLILPSAKHREKREMWLQQGAMKYRTAANREIRGLYFYFSAASQLK